MALFRKKYRQPYEAEVIIMQAYRAAYGTGFMCGINQTKFSLGMSYSKDKLISRIEPIVSKLQRVNEEHLVEGSYYAILRVNDGFKEENTFYYIGRIIETQALVFEIKNALS